MSDKEADRINELGKQYIKEFNEVRQDETRRITPPPKKKNQGLCFRCEHRAVYYETGRAPRCECGDIDSCKFACYMYRPVCPVTTTPLDKGDKRPRHGPSMISSREQFKEVASAFRLTLHQDGDSSTLYWVPKEETNV